MINTNHKLNTHDIKDLFVKIPTHEVRNITQRFLQLKGTPLTSKNQILHLKKSIMPQNYFTFSIIYFTHQKV